MTLGELLRHMGIGDDKAGTCARVGCCFSSLGLFVSFSCTCVHLQRPGVPVTDGAREYTVSIQVVSCA